MANIKDLARYCNVSVSTVSYALNNSDEISEETKHRIRKAAKELNYVPNAYARGLKNKQTFNIGIFIPGFEGPIHHTVLSGIARVINQNDNKYNMIVTLADEKMLLIKERSVDLAVIMDSRVRDDVIKELSSIVPIITFDKKVDGDNIFNTFLDNADGMYKQTLALIEKGCKKIAYMLGSRESYHNHLRFEGYLRGLKENNKVIDLALVYDADAFVDIRGYEVMNNIISDNNGILPFDAIICANDELAIGAIKSLIENGFKVPEQIKVTGFDNIDKSSYVTPTISTVAVDWFHYGENLANLALDILNKKETSGFSIPIEIIQRESSK